MAARYGWFVPNHHSGSSFYKSPRNKILEVTHVARERNAYHDNP